jgi:uncharacterized DUF497 family protein
MRLLSSLIAFRVIRFCGETKTLACAARLLDAEIPYRLPMPIFEWSLAKARKNLTKHGVDFDMAKHVFLDRAGVIDFDDNDPDEERWRIIGRVGSKLLFVVFTEPDEDVIRIISAREASKREQRRYYGQASS